MATMILHLPAPSGGSALLTTVVQILEDIRGMAIGAFSSATLGYFDVEEKEYEQNPVQEQVELLSLIGDIAMNGEEPQLQAHVVLGRRDGTTRGGHLLEAYVRPTLEVVLVESQTHLKKKTNEEFGLALINL